MHGTAIPRGDQRKLKKICLKSQIWKGYQAEKEQLVVKSMVNITPILIDFFDKIRIK